MKTCTACKQSLSLELFANNKAKKDGKHNQCKACKNSYNKKYYTDTKHIHNPDRYERRIRMYQIRRGQVLEYLKVNPCVDCKESDPIVLEFDHVRGEKLFNISDGMKHMKPEKLFWSEIAKCDVRCANCHKRKTARDYGWFKASPVSSEEEHSALNGGVEIS